MHKIPFPRILSISLLGAVTAVAQSNDVYMVKDYGAKGDGKTDDTAAFQKAMDAASAAGGGNVVADRGNFFFAGHLNIPKSVCLEGVWPSVTSHTGIRNRGRASGPEDNGTTFLITEGAGNEDGPAFITMGENATLRGIVMYYPNQRTDQEPTAYPWNISLRSRNCDVEDIELLNSYNGINGTGSERHLIRNVSGQPLRRGIFVDNILDIGRIENVHFNPWWTMNSAAYRWEFTNGEAFIFGRSDWEYVLNTFAFGYKVGYKFIHTRTGECNGNFVGIGADDCNNAVLVEQSAPYGILIVNGEFTSFHGPNPTEVVTSSTNRGPVRFENCAFWGPGEQIAKIGGTGVVGFSDCTFCDWGHLAGGTTDWNMSAIQVNGPGTVLIRGCEFQKAQPQVELGSNTVRAVIADNVIAGPIRVVNNSSRQFQIHDNATDGAAAATNSTRLRRPAN